ncbi:MAG: hypothetical protein ABJZ55_20415 [Fuerstiella sp.]
MTTKTITIESNPYWESPVLRLLPVSSGVVIDSQSASVDDVDLSRYTASFSDLAAGRYRWRLVSLLGAVVDGGFVTVGEVAGQYFAENLLPVSDLAEGLQTYFSTAEVLPGNMTILAALNVVVAAVAGINEELPDGREQFRDLGDSVAFTTTFDADGFRSNVEVPGS